MFQTRRNLLAAAACVAALSTSAGNAVAQPGDHPAESVPPVAKTHVDARYPESALAAKKHAIVVLLVTVDPQGHVSRVDVAESGGPDLDASATEAMRQWSFEPAKRAGTPVAARIRVPFHFVPPSSSPEPPVAGSSPHTAGGVVPPKPPAPAPMPGAQEVLVEGQARAPSRGASDFRLDEKVLRAAPHASASDLLSTAPGVYVSHPEGEAIAQRIYLRGFDADHGQDIELRVAGIPLNQASHIHGQGYADLGIIIPETVRSLRVVEGVYDPRQGDFAVAGSADYDLGVKERGLLLSYGRASFGTDRALAIWAPEKAPEETFAAAHFKSTDGFGPGVRGATNGGALAQYKVRLSGSSHLLLHAGAYAARSNIAGVLRRDDIDAGRVGFYDAYPDPTARSQSAATSRTQFALSFEDREAEGARTTAGVWLALSSYRSRLNFTGYTQRSRVQPEWVGRGDLTEQGNQDFGVGTHAAYRTNKVSPTSFLDAQVEVGAESRTDVISQQQNLLQAPQNETWDQRVDAQIRQTDIGAFADALLAAKKYARLRGGLRADLLTFDVDDKLGNFIPSFSAKSHIAGFRRTAAGIAWGPRASLEVEPIRPLLFSLSYGEGFRSPQARQLEEGEQAPFSRVRSYEAGATLRAGDHSSISLIGYQTNLSYDLAFDAGEARLERIGPTTRKGVVAYLRSSPVSFLDAQLSATFVRATLDSPPTPTPEDPAPAFVAGQALPYVPAAVVRQDVSVHGDLLTFYDRTVVGSVGYGTTFLSPRPLPYGKTSTAVFLVDAQASLRRDFFELSLASTNLLGARYADTEYAFVSNWQSQTVPSLLPARHISAGSPRTLFLTATLHL